MICLRPPDKGGGELASGGFWFLVALLFPLLAWTAEIPPLKARVTDLTGTLNPQQRGALEQTLAEFESRKGAFHHFMDDDEIHGEVEHYYNDAVLKGILQNPANAIYVAERGKEMLGYCIVLPKDRRGRPRILQFFVAPKAQRQGVGELLFEHSINHLKEAGVPEVFISTLSDNVVGHSFFTKQGCRLIYDYDSVWDGTVRRVLLFYKAI